MGPFLARSEQTVVQIPQTALAVCPEKTKLRTMKHYVIRYSN